MSTPEETPPTPPDHASKIEPKPETKPAVPPTPPKLPNRRPLFIGLGILIVAALLWWGLPVLISSFSTLSTDDAYVNGHVTFVAARVPGQVAKVLVDDNNRVRQGDLLVQLDKEPYQVQVEVKKAALDAAKADLIAADASVRGAVAHARSQRFNMERSMEDVDNQVGLLRARVAALEQAKATLALAESEFTHSQQLLDKKVVSKEEFDQRQQALSVAQAQVNQAIENVSQGRVALGLPATPASGTDLAQVPPRSQPDLFLRSPG